MCDLGYPLSNRYVTQEQVAVVLFQREFPARQGGGESKVQRLWGMMYE